MRFGAQPARRAPRLVVFPLLMLLARLAAASPIDDPFVGGLSFTGPTAGDLGAVYWNPAALGLLRGFQLMVAGTARVSSVTVNRAPIDPSSGQPFGTQVTGSATARDFRQPFQWPPGPGSYLAIGYGSDRFTIAFATYMPYLEKLTFPTSAAGDEPTRYQMLSLDLRNLALVPALAIRFGSDLRIGLAPGFLFSTGSLDFAEDTALDAGPTGLTAYGPENPTAAARYHVSSGQGIGSAKFSVTLGGGIYYRRRSVELGLSYQSRPLGSGVSGVEVSGEQSSITLPPAQGGGSVICAGGQTARCVFGDATYRLPDVFIGGATWHVRPGLELSLTARWLWLHLHDRIDVRLVSPALDATRLPQHIVLYRGFHDVVDTRARVAYWWHERVRVGAELRVETGALDANAVSAAAVDALKLEPVALAELRIGRHFWLAAGYGLTIMPGVTVTDSVFNPQDAVDCAKASGDLAIDPCKSRLAGTARPTAAGTYTAFAQDFGLTLNMKF